MAILARWGPPIATSLDLPGDAADGQCRYLEAAVNGVLVASIMLRMEILSQTFTEGLGCGAAGLPPGYQTRRTRRLLNDGPSGRFHH